MKNNTKDTIRHRVLSRRNNLDPDMLAFAETEILEKITQRDDYQYAKTVMIYMDFRQEVPTGKLINHILASGKRLVLPLTDSTFTIIPYEIIAENHIYRNYLKQSSFGIFEPDPALCKTIPPQEIDLVLIPGAAFDQEGNRIGYGKGCYDRFLPLLRQDAVKLALAFDFQLLDQIPAGPTDIKMDGIITVAVE